MSDDEQSSGSDVDWCGSGTCGDVESDVDGSQSGRESCPIGELGVAEICLRAVLWETLDAEDADFASRILGRLNIVMLNGCHIDAGDNLDGVIVVVDDNLAEACRLVEMYRCSLRVLQHAPSCVLPLSLSLALRRPLRC
jgi:hypothetical protein